jgi:hypothetical protein
MPQRAARVVVLLVASLTAGFVVPSATGVSGELRVLYVLATWGPTPFTRADAEHVARETDAFFQASSSGRLSMPGFVVGPILLPRAVFDSCNATTIRNEAPRSTLAGYDRVVLVTPLVDACRFAGEARATEVLLNGRLDTALAVHELGHTLGLDHANSWHCIALGCTVDEYGNPFSVMGGGSGDFNAYEKAKLEWLNGLVRARGDATYEIGPIEGPPTLPQALVVTTAASEFWIEYRGRATPSFAGDSEQPPGVAVIAGPAPGSQMSPYPDGNILLPNPSGGARVAYTTGESFAQRDVFTVVVEGHTSESAALGFEWLDRVAPNRPRLHVRAKGRGRIEVSWGRARERGSGVETYTVLSNGQVAGVFDAKHPGSSATLSLSRGTHRVSVYATDRAGNRSIATSARVRVR